jgi:tRNA G18 (ribose-2'-O)-methylase SpoU
LAQLTPDIIALTSADDPRVADYRQLKEHTLKEASGKFVAESEPVVRKLLQSPLPVHSLLLTELHLHNLAPDLRPGVPVYVAPPPVLDTIAGFHVHRGCLAIGARPTTTLAALPPSARTLVILEDLVDVDNVGALARNAAAFGADSLLLSPRAADPFYRKAVRVSMGTVFALPIIRLGDWLTELGQLQARGFALVGTVLDAGATPLHEFTWPTRAAILFGAEGPGLSAGAKAACDHLVTIPMAQADSLNVATAGALFLHDRVRRSGVKRAFPSR